MQSWYVLFELMQSWYTGGEVFLEWTETGCFGGGFGGTKILTSRPTWYILP